MGNGIFGNSIIMGILGLCIGIGLAVLKELFTREKEDSEIEKYAEQYEKTPILTEHEKANYNIMLPVTQRLRLEIFAKVRLADIITPVATGKERQKYFNKIKSKHCDFVLCDSRMNIVAVVEIDDATHQKNERKARYNFTDFVLKDCGIETLHYTNINALEFENKIRSMIGVTTR